MVYMYFIQALNVQVRGVGTFAMYPKLFWHDFPRLRVYLRRFSGEIHSSNGVLLQTAENTI